MDFGCCVFVDDLDREEGVEYVELDDIQYMFECVEQCRRVSVMERITNNIKDKRLLIHTCVSYEKGFFTWLERILSDKKKSKIDIIVLRTWDLPEIFEKRCRVVKRDRDDRGGRGGRGGRDSKDGVWGVRVWGVGDSSTIVKKRDIEKYRDKISQLSYLRAYIKEEEREEIISIMNK